MTDDADPVALLPTVANLARAAGIVVFGYYRGGFRVRRKADTSPVTEADEAAEGLILAGLAELTPGLPAISEESFAHGRSPGIGKGRFWLVDPLDGTREFVNRTDEFSINIALIENGRPVLGVIHAPMTEETYAAAGGEATLTARGGKPRRIGARRAPRDGIDVVESRSHGDAAATGAFLEDFVVRSRKRLGSAVKFGLLASGLADLYPRFGPTMEWDTAAGHAILDAAGGNVRSTGGMELAYGKPGFANPDFIARGLPD